jgi:hypothetical protein
MMVVAAGGTSFAAAPVAFVARELGLNSRQKTQVAAIADAQITAASSAVQQYGATLPSGKTETGVWGGEFYAIAGASKYGEFTASFPIALAAPLTGTHAILVSGASAANCPGVGQAAAGYLCAYETAPFGEPGVRDWPVQH